MRNVLIAFALLLLVTFLIWYGTGEVSAPGLGSEVPEDGLNPDERREDPNPPDGIGEDTDTPDSEPEPNVLVGTSWVWLETNLLNGADISAPAGGRFVLTFEADGNLGSTTDCNAIGGSYVVDGEVLSVGSLMSTKMYCEGSMEAEYARDLALVSSYTIVGDTLTLTLNRDYGTMTFKRNN